MARACVVDLGHRCAVFFVCVRGGWSHREWSQRSQRQLSAPEWVESSNGGGGRRRRRRRRRRAAFLTSGCGSGHGLGKSDLWRRTLLAGAFERRTPADGAGIRQLGGCTAAAAFVAERESPGFSRAYGSVTIENCARRSACHGRLTARGMCNAQRSGRAVVSDRCMACSWGWHAPHLWHPGYHRLLQRLALLTSRPRTMEALRHRCSGDQQQTGRHCTGKGRRRWHGAPPRACQGRHTPGATPSRPRS